MGKEKVEETKIDISEAILEDEQDEQGDEMLLRVASPEMIEAMKNDLKQGFDFITNIIYTLDIRKDGNMYELRQFAIKDLISARHFAELLLKIEERYTEAHAQIEEEEKETSETTAKDKEGGGKEHLIEVKDSLDIKEKMQ